MASEETYENVQPRISRYTARSAKKTSGQYSFGSPQSHSQGASSKQPTLTEIPAEVETEDNYITVQSDEGDDDDDFSDTVYEVSDWPTMTEVSLEMEDEDEYMAVEDSGDISSRRRDGEEGQINGKYNRDPKADKGGPMVGAEIEIGVDGGCMSSSTEYGSIFIKELCGGVSHLDFQGPAVGCTLSKGDGPEIVSDCTTSACAADFVIKELVLCTLGLSLDTKFVWTEDRAEFLVLGTGVETTEGFAVDVLGSKVGYADMEKVARAREKRRKRHEDKVKRRAVVDKQPTGHTNTAIARD